jgi:hypothetical protein
VHNKQSLYIRYNFWNDYLYVNCLLMAPRRPITTPVEKDMLRDQNRPKNCCFIGETQVTHWQVFAWIETIDMMTGSDSFADNVRRAAILLFPIVIYFGCYYAESYLFIDETVLYINDRTLAYTINTSYTLKISHLYLIVIFYTFSFVDRGYFCKSNYHEACF